MENTSTTIENLFQQYLQHGKYIKGWSTKTPVVYQRAFTSFQQSLQLARGVGIEPTQPDLESSSPSLGTLPPTKAHLEAWIVWMRQKNLAPACINIYLRAMNAFCAWLKDEGHITQAVKIKQVPAPIKPVIVFSDADVRAILSFKPHTFTDWRLFAMVQTLLDTGCRINEVLSLELANVDFDNLLMMVDGKGGKRRKVPFSPELRKTLWRWKQMTAKRFTGRPQVFVFSTRQGQKLRYRNAYRDLINLCQAVGITKRVHCHLTRHTFACHFMKNGGSIYTLSRILGHSSVTTTQTYIRGLGVEDFQQEQARLSPVARLG